MGYLKVSLIVFSFLAISRFIPHPPNFTSLQTLSFYLPAVFGIKFIPIVLFSLIITDTIIGIHSVILFTWGSVICIGIISKYFNRSILFRFFGVMTGVVIFFILSNFGVWLNGAYGYNFRGFVECYMLALPFFGYSLISTIFFSFIIELAYKLFRTRFLNLMIKINRL
ncbi:hypothetical protein N9U51_03630 [Candidatus Pelagibacter sp.]|nr:hypothetical protein [Candidatus Pelagibacter sp.]